MKSLRLVILAFIVVAATDATEIHVTFTAARTSCVAPCAVFFDATATTATGVVYPFHELDYAWDFGDLGAGNWTYGAENGTPGAGSESKFNASASGTTLTVHSLAYGTVSQGLVLSGAGVSGTPMIVAGAYGVNGPGTYTLSSSQSFTNSDLTTQTFIPTTIWNADRNKAYGPLTAHLFKTAGTFTVNLTVKGASGMATATPVTITVTDPDVYFGAKWNGSKFSINETNVGGTVCISNSATWAGCPDGARQVLMRSGKDDLAMIIGLHANGYSRVPIRVLLRRGDSFTIGSSGQDITKAGPGQLGAYGTGALPRLVLAQNLGSTSILYVCGAPWDKRKTCSDWRITDLALVTGSYVAIGIGVTGDQTTINNFNFGTTIGGLGGGNAYPDRTDQFYLGNTTAFRLTSNANGAGTGYFSGISRSAWMGNDWEDGTHAGWLTRIQDHEKLVWSHNLFARAASNKAVVFFHGNQIGAAVSGTDVISDNILEADSWGYNILSITPQNNGYPETLANAIIERNWFVAPGASNSDAIEIKATKVTTRLNIFQNTQPWIVPPQTYWNTINVAPLAPVTANLWYYNNTLIDLATSAPSSFISDYFAGRTIGHWIARNNIVYMPHHKKAQVINMASPGVADHNTADTGSTKYSVNPLYTNGSGNFSLPTDFALQSGSYGKGAGTTAPPVFYDFFRNPIPASNPNMGAIQ